MPYPKPVSGFDDHGLEKENAARDRLLRLSQWFC
jgi:hypothetical protein